MGIQYVKGDATNPQGNGSKVIVHCCNDIGAWGRGFVLALSKRWNIPEKAYRDWFNTNKSSGMHEMFGRFKLGRVQFVKVENDIIVGNMIGQHNIHQKNGIPPIRYDAIRSCLKQVCEFAKNNNSSIHAPRFGSGLAGGSWNEIEKIINEELINNGIKVIIYDL